MFIFVIVESIWMLIMAWEEVEVIGLTHLHLVNWFRAITSYSIHNSHIYSFQKKRFACGNLESKIYCSVAIISVFNGGIETI